MWHKTFGPAQNILGPVKGQGITSNLVFGNIFVQINKNSDFVSILKKIECENFYQRPRGIFQVSILTQVT